MKYCHLCGAKYVEGSQQPWVCSSCGNQKYLNASPTADILLFDSQGRALISERGIEPAKGKYDLPGGFVELEETILEGMYREAEEELGLKAEDFTEPVFVYSHNTQYEFSKEVNRVVGCTFAARLLTDKEISPHDDVASVKFVTMDELDSVDFSLSAYPEIIRGAHKKLFGADQ